MPKSKSSSWYGVAAGKSTGVFSSWDECNAQVNGYKGARYKKFSTRMLAENYVETNGTNNENKKQNSFNVHNVTNVNVYYGVAKGHCPGIYKSWSECKEQINGYSKPVFKKFKHLDDAKDFCSKNSNGALLNIPKFQIVIEDENFAGNKLDNSFDLEVLQEGGFSPSKDDNISDFEDENDENNSMVQEIAALAKQDVRNVHLIHNIALETCHVVYTDGSCLNQGSIDGSQSAGIGVYWAPGDSRNLSERMWGIQTNQRAELWAAIRAIQTALSDGLKKLEIRTDSIYTIKGTTEWVKRWKNNGYLDVNGKGVKNMQLFKKLDSLTAILDVKWVHIKAHSGNHGNEAADRLAKSGAKKPLNQEI